MVRVDHRAKGYAHVTVIQPRGTAVRFSAVRRGVTWHFHPITRGKVLPHIIVEGGTIYGTAHNYIRMIV